MYPVKIIFKSKEEMKTFSNKNKLIEFVTRTPALQNMLKKLFREEENYIGQKLVSI